MKQRNMMLGKDLAIPLILVSLVLLNIAIIPVSGFLYDGKTDDFEYQFMAPSGWHKYVRFEVVERPLSEGIAIISVTTETTEATTYEDFRLKIPEWSIIDENGSVIDSWPYCPIWFDLSPLEVGMEFNDTEHWFYNFTVDSITTETCNIERATQGEEYIIYQHLYYDVDSNRIRQYDYSMKYPSNTVYTIRLKYLPEGWNFAPAPIVTDPSIIFLLLVGIFVELVIITLIFTRHFSKPK